MNQCMKRHVRRRMQVAVHVRVVFVVARCLFVCLEKLIPLVTACPSSASCYVLGTRAYQINAQRVVLVSHGTDDCRTSISTVLNAITISQVAIRRYTSSLRSYASQTPEIRPPVLADRPAPLGALHRGAPFCGPYSMGAKYSAVHCMRNSMQQQVPAEEDSDRKTPGFRNCHHQWTRLQTSGCLPSPRSGHDVVVIGSKAYLFGGCGGAQDQITCLNDVYVFDLELHRWDKVGVKGDAPLPRASFGMCAGPAEDTLIVAGGTGVEMDSLRADVVEYSVPNRTWTRILTDSEETPCKFYGQSVCTYGDNLLLFGGSTGLHYTNDLFEYNVLSNKWKRLVTSGRMPSPRYKHQAVVVRDKMYVIGGGCFKPEQSSIDLYCLDLKSLVWEETVMKGELPKARVAHSCSFDAETDTIFLWGGFTSELSRLQDFFGFHCPTATWVQMAEQPTQAPAAGGAADLVGAPPARAFHSAAFFQGGLYVFSGANGDVRYSDVWRFQVRSTPPSLAILVAHKLRSAGKEALRDMEFRAPEEVVQGVQQMNEHADILC